MDCVAAKSFAKTRPIYRSLDAQDGYHNASRTITEAVDGGLFEEEEATLYLAAAKQAYWRKHDATSFPNVVGCAAAKISKRKCEALVLSEDYPMPLS
eukprot:1487431-Karenia_brevis.AAC.1